MNRLQYLVRSLVYYRRTHLAAVLGAATATAVLTGALLTGVSVKRSLRDLVLQRLGATDYVLSSRGFFRASLAQDFAGVARACSLIALEGTATHESSSRRAAVMIYGVDDSFYRFHGVQAKAPGGRDAFLSPALAAEFGAKSGESVLVRVEEPSAIPREFLHGRKDETARVVRLRVADSVTPAAMGDFLLGPSQGDVRAVFVPLERLQKDLNFTGRANLVLLSTQAPAESVAERLRERFRLEDAGLRLRPRRNSDELVLEQESTILDDRTAERAIEAGKAVGILTRPSLIYLANFMRAGKATVPYSLVAAVDDATLAEINGDRPLPATKKTPILLNDWAAMDLGVKPGEKVTLEYFVWTPNGELKTQTSEFELAAVIPIRGLAADRDLAPMYPGITDQATLSGWDPPFPIDLKKVRPRDEQYWQLHRTTPKAWVPLEAGRKLWGTRFGSYTSVRFLHDDPTLMPALRDKIDPLAAQFTLSPVRRQSLEAASGSTDFGEYFLYFSFFVLVAALLLMALFFRLAVEQRRSEIGLLRAVGATGRDVRLLFLAEGIVVAFTGSALGVLLAPLYAGIILHGLRTWWSGATGTSLLHLSADRDLMIAGGVTGFAVAGLSVWQALRRWEGLSPKAMYGGEAAAGPAWRLKLGAWGTLGLAILMMGISFLRVLPASGGFFGAGVLLLISCLCWGAIWLRRPFLGLVAIPGDRALMRLAARNGSWRPGRTLLSLALIAPASFLLMSLEAFRHGGNVVAGAFPLYAESQAPLLFDPNTASGADSLNLQGLPPMKWVRFRLRPGDDVSCLNLYEPRNPRILGAPESFFRENKFRFAATTGESAETRANPGLLLETQLNGGVIPAIVDQNSLQYVLHKKLGDEVVIEREGSQPLRLKLVAALEGSLFQSEILIGEKNFVRQFPQIAGWRVFLIYGPLEAAGPLEEALSNYGFDAQPAAERLAAYHRVENTYLSTFQALGGFGLLLGTLGLAAVLLRNALERRRELSLLRATGFSEQALQKLLAFETAAVLAAGLAAGALCALLAVAPALVSRGVGLPALSMGGLLLLIFAGGLAASWAAARVALRTPLVEALRGD
jgi:ABC-type antimicrobial peptide transport system permease subunit